MLLLIVIVSLYILLMDMGDLYHRCGCCGGVTFEIITEKHLESEYPPNLSFVVADLPGHRSANLAVRVGRATRYKTYEKSIGVINEFRACGKRTCTCCVACDQKTL